MMQIKIQNARLGQAINLLFNLSLKGKQSRHRTKFINLLTDRLKEVEEQRIQLAKEHSTIDEEGNPEMKDNGQSYDIKDQESFQKDIEELFEEEMAIEGGDAQGMLKTVKDVLLNCDKEFSGQEASSYDYLCELFEKAE